MEPRSFDDFGREEIKDEINRSYDQLASLVGEKTVLGFRAPYFSLTNSTPWAADQINNAGFKYSSSVLPGKNPQFAYDGAPDLPFKWPNGLPEFPVPVLKILGSTFPAIGGGYLRILPSLVVNRFWRNPKIGQVSGLTVTHMISQVQSTCQNHQVGL